MCGFAGEFMLAASDGPPGRRADLDVALRMADALRHRGPDEGGHYASPDGRCAIAFHRLAVIDLAHSHQPMTSPDGTATVAFNGEIYNYRRLRGELESDGCRLSTQGDTEVLLHLYRRDGADMLAALDGMFAFAIYDASEKRLMLARDRLGQKPLWYAALADRVVFASEAPALLRHPIVSEDLDRRAITYYMTMGYIPAPLSAWASIRKLVPAHYLCAGSGLGDPQCYWRPEPGEVPESPRERIEVVRSSIRQAVEARMVSEVPLGALLSGGLDSAIVVSQMVAAAGTSGGVRTFTAGFECARYDERPIARQTARRLGTDHIEVLVRPSPADSLDELVARYGEPFADSSALPTYEICKAAREHVTVALVGDGGDEVFCGYDRYAAMDLASRLGPLGYLAIRVGGGIAGMMASRNERCRLRRLARFAAVLPHHPAEQYFRLRSLFGPDDLARVFSEEFMAGLEAEEPAEWFLELYDGPEDGFEMADEPLYAQRHDMLTYLPDDLLVKADIASMACSLELRAPLLDHRLVGLGLSLPGEARLTGRKGKAILREAFAGELPRDVVRGLKCGFGVPLRDWLAGELYEVVRETLMDPWLHGLGMFRPEGLAGLLNDHFDGRADYSHRLWALLVLGRWLRMRGGA